MNIHRSIQVDTPSKSYEVRVGRGLIDAVGTHIAELLGEVSVCIVSDSTVAPLYAQRVQNSLTRAGISNTLIEFPAGEAHKNLEVLGRILDGIAQAQLSRADCIVGLGGGVTGDVAGLAAAMYMRGCHVVHIPTSLLAMVDSSVGGKTAIDLPSGKNLAGAFFQPEAVLVDVELLTSLSSELFCDSCAEMIKHAVIADEQLFKRLSTSAITADVEQLDELQEIVARNIEIKRDVVINDEKEQGLRQLLNLGHTIGHAIEAASNFRLGHGSSVAAGMCCMARACAQKGWCSHEVPSLIEACCALYGLPTDTDVAHDVLMGYLSHDKKRTSDGYTIVVPVAIGQVELKHVSSEEMAEIVRIGCGLS